MELITKAKQISSPSLFSEDNLGSIALGIVRPPGQLTVHIFGKKKIPSINFFYCVNLFQVAYSRP